MTFRALQIGLALCAFAVSLPVLATAQRTFVSTTGVNNPGCSLIAPCRDFASAIAATSVGGEVIVLDSGGYGPVTIAQSVSIVAPDGVYAGITVFSGNGVTIGTAGINVTLKGLTINGIGGVNGILMTGGASLRVERCTVSGFMANATAGINIGSASKVSISDTVVSQNNIGIVLDGGANVEVARVNAIGNANTGILMAGTSNATTNAVVTETRALGNGICGLQALGQTTSTGGGFGSCATCTRIMTVSRSTASNNLSGYCQAGIGAVVTVGSSVASQNQFYGLEQDFGGTFRSAQDNISVDNGSGPTIGTITTAGVRF